jgi:hypothetical protein
MTSPDRVVAPRQNHREGTGSRASVLRSEPQREGRRLAQLLRVKCKEIKRTVPIRCIIDIRPR